MFNIFLGNQGNQWRVAALTVQEFEDYQVFFFFNQSEMLARI